MASTWVVVCVIWILLLSQLVCEERPWNVPGPRSDRHTRDQCPAKKNKRTEHGPGHPFGCIGISAGGGTHLKRGLGTSPERSRRSPVLSAASPKEQSSSSLRRGSLHLGDTTHHHGGVSLALLLNHLTQLQPCANG